MLKQLIFHTPDFIESTSWVTQLLEKDGGEVILEVKENECVFSFRNRSSSLQSSTFDVTTVFDEEDDDEPSIFKIEAAPLARFLKAIPKRAEKVVLDVEFSDSGKVRALAAQAGSLKFKLPTFSEPKAPSKLKYTTVASLPAKELFEAMAKAGNASTKEKGGTNNYAMLDFHVEKIDDKGGAVLKIFGTDSFIMNVSELSISNETEEETRILIPASYSALPEFAAASKADEVVDIVKTTTKKPALGFLFPNGYVAIFNPTSAEPILAAPKVFEQTVSSSTHYFDVETKDFKAEISRVTTLNPDTEKVYLSLTSDKVVFSDGADAVADMDMEVFNSDGEADSEFDTHSITFSKFVLTKMFSVIPAKSRIYFSTGASKAIYVVPTPEEDGEDKGVSQESPLISEKSIVVLFRER